MYWFPTSLLLSNSSVTCHAPWQWYLSTLKEYFSLWRFTYSSWAVISKEKKKIFFLFLVSFSSHTRELALTSKNTTGNSFIPHTVSFHWVNFCPFSFCIVVISIFLSQDVAAAGTRASACLKHPSSEGGQVRDAWKHLNSQERACHSLKRCRCLRRKQVF